MTDLSAPSTSREKELELPRVLEVSDLVRRYGSVTALHGVSFHVARGEMFGVIGPDGAGKTTAIKCLLGLLRPDAGRIQTLGLDPTRERRALAHRIGYLSQRFSIYGDLSIDENIAFFADVHGVSKWRPRRDALLERLRLAPFRTRLADRLSGGMKQKLALACTLIHTPDLLVLDEPTTGVDPVSRRDFWRILSGLQREGLSILVTTPYLDEAERCQRVALVDRGRIMATDTPERLRRSVPALVVEVMAEPTNRVRDLLRTAPEVRDLEIFGERVHAYLEQRAEDQVGPALAALRARLEQGGASVELVRAIEPTLEDLFIFRMRESAAAERSR